MWLLAVLSMVSTTPQSGGMIVGGTPFGPKQSLTCTWFTNFENSRFLQCWSSQGKPLLAGDGASVECTGRLCQDLDADARKVARWRRPEPPWGRFKVQVVGRISLQPHKKQYVGDGTDTVLIEELVRVWAYKPPRGLR